MSRPWLETKWALDTFRCLLLTCHSRTGSRALIPRTHSLFHDAVLIILVELASKSAFVQQLLTRVYCENQHQVQTIQSPLIGTAFWIRTTLVSRTIDAGYAKDEFLRGNKNFLSHLIERAELRIDTLTYLTALCYDNLDHDCNAIHLALSSTEPHRRTFGVFAKFELAMMMIRFDTRLANLCNKFEDEVDEHFDPLALAIENQDFSLEMLAQLYWVGCRLHVNSYITLSRERKSRIRIEKLEQLLQSQATTQTYHTISLKTAVEKYKSEWQLISLLKTNHWASADGTPMFLVALRLLARAVNNKHGINRQMRLCLIKLFLQDVYYSDEQQLAKFLCVWISQCKLDIEILLRFAKKSLLEMFPTCFTTGGFTHIQNRESACFDWCDKTKQKLLCNRVSYFVLLEIVRHCSTPIFETYSQSSAKQLLGDMLKTHAKILNILGRLQKRSDVNIVQVLKYFSPKLGCMSLLQKFMKNTADVWFERTKEDNSALVRNIVFL